MIRLFLLNLFVLPLLSAQNQPVQVSTRLLTYAPGGLPDSFQGFYQNGQVVEAFRASSGTLGLPIDYTGPPVFQIRGSAEDFALVEGQTPKPPLASITLPPGADNVLLLCAAQPDGRIGLVAYDISSGDLKKGTYRAFNFSKSTISVIMGDTKFALAPGKDTMVRDSKWHDEGMVFPMQIALLNAGQPKLVFSSYWEHFPQRRSLLFFFDGQPGAKRIAFANFSAEPPPPKPAVAKTGEGTP